MAEQQGSTIQERPTLDQLDQVNLALCEAHAIVEMVRHHAEVEAVANHFMGLVTAGVYKRNDNMPFFPADDVHEQIADVLRMAAERITTAKEVIGQLPSHARKTEGKGRAAQPAP